MCVGVRVGVNKGAKHVGKEDGTFRVRRSKEQKGNQKEEKKEKRKGSTGSETDTHTAHTHIHTELLLHKEAVQHVCNNGWEHVDAKVRAAVRRVVSVELGHAVIIQQQVLVK